MSSAPLLNILLAENDADDRILIQEAVESSQARCEIHWVENGEVALQYLRAEGRYADQSQKALPDLIMLDLNMPVMDGWETLEALKADTHLSSIPVIFLTTSETADDVRRAYRMGASSYITKPASFDALVAIVEKITNYWTTTSEHYPQKSEFDDLRASLMDD